MANSSKPEGIITPIRSAISLLLLYFVSHFGQCSMSISRYWDNIFTGEVAVLKNANKVVQEVPYKSAVDLGKNYLERDKLPPQTGQTEDNNDHSYPVSSSDYKANTGSKQTVDYTPYVSKRPDIEVTPSESAVSHMPVRYENKTTGGDRYSIGVPGDIDFSKSEMELLRGGMSAPDSYINEYPVVAKLVRAFGKRSPVVNEYILLSIRNNGAGLAKLSLMPAEIMSKQPETMQLYGLLKGVRLNKDMVNVLTELTGRKVSVTNDKFKDYYLIEYQNSGFIVRGIDAGAEYFSNDEPISGIKLTSTTKVVVKGNQSVNSLHAKQLAEAGITYIKSVTDLVNELKR